MATCSMGCEHYTRSCSLQAPCCNKFYTCRLCHDENENHQMDRFRVSVVQCSTCKKIQQAQKMCEGCNIVFGEYYCEICHLYDKNKEQYHCTHCGICRIGPKEKFFHCTKCNLCLAMDLQGNHKCVENVSRQNCPVCMEDMHTSRVYAQVLPCGHLLHSTCYSDMLKKGSYRCPVCMQSAVDMTQCWQNLDEEVSQTPMPPEYQNMTVMVLCNDCHIRSSVPFHVLGMKCPGCGSYNTVQDGMLVEQQPSQQEQDWQEEIKIDILVIRKKMSVLYSEIVNMKKNFLLYLWIWDFAVVANHSQSVVLDLIFLWSLTLDDTV